MSYAHHESPNSSMVRASDGCTEGHGFDSRRGLRFFLCPTLATCWIFHLFLYTPNWKRRRRVKSINHWRCDPMVLWEAWILASILSHVYIIIPQHALIYSLNYLRKKIFWITKNETQSQTCPCNLSRVPLRCIVHRLHVSPDNVFSNRCIQVVLTFADSHSPNFVTFNWLFL